MGILVYNRERISMGTAVPDDLGLSANDAIEAKIESENGVLPRASTCFAKKNGEKAQFNHTI